MYRLSSRFVSTSSSLSSLRTRLFLNREGLDLKIK